MITQNTVSQLLEVLRLCQQGFAAGRTIKTAYTDAVRSVANRHSVTYQNIGDGCCRRLKLENVNEFHDMLDKWVHGDASSLMNQLKACSDSKSHYLIDDFFRGRQTGDAFEKKPSVDLKGPDRSEVFSFRLDERQARKVRAIAGWSGMPAAELVRKIVVEGIETRIKSFAQELGKDAP